MHQVDVNVVSAEEADHGVAEFRSAGKLFGFTRMEEGELLLHIQPQANGDVVLVSARSLSQALARARALLQRY